MVSRRLITDGAISPLRQATWTSKNASFLFSYKNWNAIDKTKLRLNQAGSEYSDTSVQRHFKTIMFHEKVEKVVNALMGMSRKSIVVFTRFVEESQYLALKIPGVEIVTAETPKRKRDRVI